MNWRGLINTILLVLVGLAALVGSLHLWYWPRRAPQSGVKNGDAARSRGGKSALEEKLDADERG